jgi:hypothetical protein
VEGNVKGLVVKNKPEEYKDGSGYETVDLDELDVDGAGLGGFGMAVDLGAEYDFKDIVPGLKASIALLDLGFISWSESHIIDNKNGKDDQGNPTYDSFEFNGFNNIRVKDGNGKKLSDQTDGLTDDLTKLYNLQYRGDEGSSTHGIGATLNVGVEYALPVYDKVRFGLLSTTRFQGEYTWNEERLSVNYTPCKWFEMNVNGGLGTFGGSFGWMLNVHPVGFNFFIGMDHTLGSVSKQFVPLRSNADFTMGINFPLTKVKKG